MKRFDLFFALFYAVSVSAQKVPALNQKTAVLVVGKDVGAYAAEELNGLKDVFVSQGIFVYKFYYPNADWTSIQKVAQNCSYFVYSGHGYSNGGLNGGFGGIYINDFVKAEEFTRLIHFKQHPLIIIQCSCGASGGSAGDKGDIGFEVAKKRVLDTALPYFIAGAGAYFATNWLGGSKEFLIEFLKGKTLEVASVETLDWVIDEKITRTINSSTVLNEKVIYLGTSNRGAEKSYSLAYVGDSNFTSMNIGKGK
jgi:hypothetical protein